MNKILKISTILSGVIFSLSSPLLVYAQNDASNKVDNAQDALNAHPQAAPFVETKIETDNILPEKIEADAYPVATSNTNGGGTIVMQDDGTTRTLGGNALVVTEQPENVPSFDRDEAKTNAQDLKTNIQGAKADGITPEDVKTNAQTKAENAKAEGKTLPENFKEIESETAGIKSKKVGIAKKAKTKAEAEAEIEAGAVLPEKIEIATDAISPEKINKVEDYATFNQMKREKIKEKRNSKKGS